MSHRTFVGQVSVMVCALFTPLLLTTGTGCDSLGVGLFGLPIGAEMPSAEAMEYHVVLGGTAERTLIARTPDDEWASMMELYSSFNPLNPGALIEQIEELLAADGNDVLPIATDVVAVNLLTLESEVVLEDLPIDAYELMSDGRWLAWREYDWSGGEDSIHVLDLETKAESTYFPGLAGDRIHDLVAVSGGYLILEAGPTPYASTSLVLTNLETRESRTLDSIYLTNTYGGYGGQGGSALVDDDVLFASVWSVADPFDIEEEAPLTSRVDSIDIATGERSTLIDEQETDGYDALYLADDRLLAETYSYDCDPNSTTVTIREYPRTGGEGNTVFETTTTNSFETWSEVMGANSRGMLLFTVTYGDYASLFNFEMSYSMEFQGYDGSVIPLYDLTLNAWDISASAGLNGWLVDQYVLYRDPETFDYVVFDVEQQIERRIDPFGS